MISLLSVANGIDWKDPKWTAKSAEKFLLGKRAYLAVLQEKHGADEFVIERSILRQWGPVTTKPGKYGLRWHHHLACYIRKLIPGTTITPTLLDSLRIFEEAWVDRKELLNMIGSKNSGKSATMARVALAIVSLDPEFSVCRIAAPFKNAAHATIWGELTDCFSRMVEKWGEDHFPNARKVGQRCIIDGNSDRVGFIELIGVDQTGKFQGAKSVDPERGFFLLIADEVALFQGETFLDILSNVTGNNNFFGWTGCNFRRIDTMEGKLCFPTGRKYEQLDIERDWLWGSDHNSVTMRIDGHRCPNVVGQRTIYPFLLTEEKRAAMERQHGLFGPKYLEQIRSFPNTSMAEYFVLRPDELGSCGAYDDGVVIDSNVMKVGTCDTGLGGGDDCVFGALEFGQARVPTSSGAYETIQIVRPIEAFQVIQIDTSMVVDQQWMERVQRVTQRPVAMKVGAKVSPEDQVAVACGEHLLRLGIPKTRFGYDASMRGSVTHSMTTFLGGGIHTIDFGAPASDRILYEGNTAKEAYVNLRSEMYFAAANVVRSGQFRGGNMIDQAWQEVCAHQWEHRGSRQKLESKKEYKSRHDGVSPNQSDTLVIGIEVAQRHGLRFGGTRAPSKHRGRMSDRDLTGIGAFTRKQAARLR